MLRDIAERWHRWQKHQRWAQINWGLQQVHFRKLSTRLERCHTGNIQKCKDTGSDHSLLVSLCMTFPENNAPSSLIVYHRFTSYNFHFGGEESFCKPSMLVKLQFAVLRSKFLMVEAWGHIWMIKTFILSAVLGHLLSSKASCWHGQTGKHWWLNNLVGRLDSASIRAAKVIPKPW